MKPDLPINIEEVEVEIENQPLLNIFDRLEEYPPGHPPIDSESYNVLVRDAKALREMALKAKAEQETAETLHEFRKLRWPRCRCGGVMRQECVEEKTIEYPKGEWNHYWLLRCLKCSSLDNYKERA